MRKQSFFEKEADPTDLLLSIKTLFLVYSDNFCTNCI